MDDTIHISFKKTTLMYFLIIMFFSTTILFAYLYIQKDSCKVDQVQEVDDVEEAEEIIEEEILEPKQVIIYNVTNIIREEPVKNVNYDPKEYEKIVQEESWTFKDRLTDHLKSMSGGCTYFENQCYCAKRNSTLGLVQRFQVPCELTESFTAGTVIERDYAYSSSRLLTREDIWINRMTT